MKSFVTYAFAARIIKAPMNKLTFALIPFLFSCSSQSTGSNSTDLGGDDVNAGDWPAHDCEADTRDETYTAGMTSVGNANFEYKLLTSMPGPPDRGINTWSLEVKNDQGQPLGAEQALEISPFMPDHGHGSNTVPKIKTEANGTFTVDDIDLFMPGLWEIRVRVKDSEESILDTVFFNFCVRG